MSISDDSKHKQPDQAAEIKVASIGPRTILDIPLDWKGPRKQPIDISSTASPRAFRLIDCNQVLQHGRLRIMEFPSILEISYATISYIWSGKLADLADVRTFRVLGALTAHPVSVDVLNHACLVAEKQGAGYIWLDLLCIMQASDSDKAWQIEHMYEFFANCNICIILPAGMQYIARLDEETGWIHRGWTLQETLVPKRTVVLFRWSFGSGFVVVGTYFSPSNTIEEIIPGRSAIAAVKDIIDACSVGFMYFFREFPRHNAPRQPLFMVKARIFGHQSPNLLSLAAAMDDVVGVEPDVREHAIWQCAMMRTTYYPVDMVFSIMGLFGVILSVSDFAQGDRIGATIALAKKILESGKSASWLGISFRLPPCRYLATFPIFPHTGIAKKALVRTKRGLREMADFMDCEFPNAHALGAGMATGTMDDAGYLTFRSRFTCVIPEHQRPENQYVSLPHVKAINGDTWWVVDSPPSPPSKVTFASVIGWFDNYIPGGQTLALHFYQLKVMLIQEHAPGKFHIVSFGAMYHIFRKDVMGWRTREFTVGGPDPLPSAGESQTGDEDDEQDETIWDVTDNMGFEMRAFGPQKNTYNTWRDLSGPKEANAWSQIALEEYYASADRDMCLPTDFDIGWRRPGDS
ncbi:hypothetical protein F5I97DRAFT_1276372 [Phlebopus sp. FC_14]|nr:hypothetical protein F5I97DRAFT_1276372 [Phlebopus sp. FC_14]